MESRHDTVCANRVPNFPFCLCPRLFALASSCCFLPSSACGRGFYKSSSQDLQCSRCPAHSFNDREGSWRCDCEDGYYRALSDPPSVACTSKSAMPLLGKHGADRLPGSEFKRPHMRGRKHAAEPMPDLLSQSAVVSWKPQMCSMAVPLPPSMSL